jgi:transcriptional regulator
MYLRADYAELDAPLLHQFIRDNPFGILITALSSPNFPTIQCTHIPWLLDANDEQGCGLGKLRGHMARQNPHAKAIIEAVKDNHSSNAPLEQEVSVLFNGPVHSYITPKYYLETKPKTGKVVPTWNYTAAQVYGKAKIFFDSSNEETTNYLQTQITDLTKYSENEVTARMGGDNSTTWKVSDAPDRYVELLRKNIIGVEIQIERLEGKFKMSQERPEGDRNGVINGLEALNTEHGHAMAKTVDQRGKLKDARAAAAKGSED